MPSYLFYPLAMVFVWLRALVVFLGLLALLPTKAHADLQQEGRDVRHDDQCHFPDCPSWAAARGNQCWLGGLAQPGDEWQHGVLVPPSFSAGCGGIDLFGGSFSFINMNQFVDLMRAVASNAAGYAFQLAINAMCPDCGRRSAFTTHCNNGSYVKFYITAKSRPPPDCSG